MAAILTLLGLPVALRAQTPPPLPPAKELKSMSLESLLELEVTVVTKHPEKLTESPSAVQVVTGDEIRRSGATSVPEALRLASNLQVAQANAHHWAVTARGFTGAPFPTTSLANKLLVMIDGRSVYTPLFAGVFWDVQQVMLADVDRIEVISGPGGTLWGANAVNGVINIVTKSARETQGFYVEGGGGSYLQDFGAVRYGDAVGTNLFYRVYAQRADHDSSKMRNGQSAHDGWDMTQGGFRLDWFPTVENSLTLQGDAYFGDLDQPPTGSEHTVADGQNVLGRFKHVFSEDSDLTVQAYFDRTWRDLHATAFFREELNTYDVDVQHRLALGERQVVLWGLGYRLMQDEVSSPSLVFAPAQRDMELWSGFVQDEISLIPDRLRLTVGTKLEHNDFSGWEVQPSGRLAWTLTERQMVWGALAPAVRSPSRLDADVTSPLEGDRDFDSETLLSYELGYRVQPWQKLSLSLAAFFNQYDDVRSISFFPPNRFVFGNAQRADTWGLELSGTFQPVAWWRLRGGYTYLDKNFRTTSASVVPGDDSFEAVDPRHQAVLQSSFDLPGQVQLDLVGRYVSRLPAAAIAPIPGLTIPFAPSISDYVSLDVRLAWRYRQWEFSVVGQNLLDDQHGEFGGLEIPRSVYGKVAWGF